MNASQQILCPRCNKASDKFLLHGPIAVGTIPIVLGPTNIKTVGPATIDSCVRPGMEVSEIHGLVNFRCPNCSHTAPRQEFRILRVSYLSIKDASLRFSNEYCDPIMIAADERALAEAIFTKANVTATHDMDRLAELFNL